RYLVPGENLDLVNPDCPCPHGEGPLLLSLSPAELTSRIKNAYHASLLTLILADLRLEDAIEMLYDCQGRITHFEMFNLKTMTDMQVLRRKPLSMLQRAINEQNTVALKRMILNCIDSLSQSDAPEAQGRLIKFSEILNNFELVKDNYRHATLKTKIGSGSTGSSSRTHGMGFAVVDTLPAKSQREVLNRAHGNCLPVSASITQTVEYIPPPRKRGFLGNMLRLASHTRLLRWVLCDKIDGWKVSEYHIDDGACGNVVTLGGVRQEADNGLRLHHERTSPKQGPSVRYLNSTLKNLLKVFLGFIPAFLTFYLTKDWWVLAYLGGVIWFSITGIRNVIQSVLGGGGFRRSQYLRWNDFVNWDRISDSLLYTGFSVPLLDYLCKSVVLDHGLGINIASNPVLLYSLMAITNGVYISSHNIFRGLPREAALGNFFRSILSIPIAIGLNFVIVMVLSAAGVANIAVELQIWAAVISKLASDCVAGFIEGLADRKYNIAMRTWDYSEKLKQVFETFSRLEVMFPTLDMVKELNDPARFIDTLRKKHDRYIPILIANALDLLYIKMYQPRATEALRQAIARMTIDEKAVFLASQCILHEERDISRLFVDGLVGREFSKALSFYLLRHRDYLEEIEKLVATSRGRAVA
ncbi:MAG: hypothetical protein KKC99_03965, partial [Proteobacteria bacterium]|nr:hypothetical protein [Pseudomonadota bacterium]